MKILGYVCLVGLLNASLIAMESAESLQMLIPRAIDNINRAHTQLLEELVPNRRVPADILVAKARLNEEFMTKITLALVVAKKMEHFDHLSQKHFETQKALMAFRLLQVYEANRYAKQVLRPLYNMGNLWGDFFGFAYLGLAVQKSQQIDGYKTSLLCTAFGLGAFFTSCYCRIQKNKLVKQPIPTKKEVYESEKNSMGLHAVEGAMKPIKLRADNKFVGVQLSEGLATTIFNMAKNIPMQMREEYNVKHLKSLKKLRSMAFNARDIDAILAITDLIESNTV
jgi:hypothetical protein